VLPLSLVAERVGLVAAAAALGKNRKILQRWKARPGCPLASKDGKIDVEELRAWAQKEGLLDRGRGRPTGVEQALSEAAPVAEAPDVKQAAKTLERLELDADGRKLLEAIEKDDKAALLRQGLGADPKLLKKVEALGRARAALADAVKRELDNQVRRRELLAAGDVVSKWRGQVEIVKAAFEALPGKLAPRLVDQDYDTVYAALEGEFVSLLKTFSEAVPV
jgi:hypothetical protein